MNERTNGPPDKSDWPRWRPSPDQAAWIKARNRTLEDRHRSEQKAAPVDFYLSIHKLALHALLLCDVIYTSRLYRLVDNPAVQPLLLGTCAGLAILYATLSVVSERRTGIPILLLALITLLLVGQMNVFAQLTEQSINLNAGFQFVSIVTFPVFFYFSHRGLRAYAIKTLLTYAIGYTAIYAAAAALYDLSLVPAAMFRPIVITDVERGQRLFSYSAAIAFAWFFWFHRIRSKFDLLGFAGVAVCGSAIALTLSRVFIIFVAVVTLAHLFKLGQNAMKTLCLVALAAVSIAYFYGLFDGVWNPFLMFSGDSSGGARSREYEIARYFLLEHPVLGIGISPSQKEIGSLTGDNYFAAGDLGTIGIWWDLGLLGLLLFFGASYIVCTQLRDLPDGLSVPLFLTGCVLAGYGCIAPLLFSPGGSTYLAVVLGLWMDSSLQPAEGSNAST